MNAAGEEVFRRRATLAVVVAGALSFVAALAYGLFSEEWASVPTYSAATYSRSAIGHAAFLDLLRRLDMHVVVSRFRSGNKAAAGGLLVLAEPLDGGARERRTFGEVVGGARRVLLVLPKWRGVADPREPAYLRAASLVGTDEIEEVLDWAGVPKRVVRPGLLGAPRWSGGSSPIVPALPWPQLLGAGPHLEPLLSCDSGVLIARVRARGRELYLLSDPDLLSNHGLGRGGNAAIAVGLLERARGSAGAIIFDETMHGFELRPSLWGELLRFPLVLAMLHAIWVVAFLLWAATGRFGRPRPLPPRFEPGNRFLIENTAALLQFGGHDAHVLERYLATAMQEAAQATPPPGHVGPQELAGWLGEVEGARGGGGRLAALRDEVGARGARRRPELLRLAGRIHRWREEWTHGA